MALTLTGPVTFERFVGLTSEADDLLRELESIYEEYPDGPCSDIPADVLEREAAIEARVAAIRDYLNPFL
jgi:hypothetical protein